MKRPEIAAAAAARSNGVYPDANWAKRYPQLAQYLATEVWDDGTPRERSALSVFTEDGVVKVAMNDKELTRSAYASGMTLDAALSSLEKGIADGTATWRSWAPKKGIKK